MGKGTKKARAEPVPRSKVRNTTMVMIFVEIVMSIPHMGAEGYANIMQLSFQSNASSYDSTVAGNN
jgi:hypothetical protein